MKVPRLMRRLSRDASIFRDRPVLVANSFPKSGTHLLLQILQALPNTCYFESFVSSLSRKTLIPKSMDWHTREFGKMGPGEAVGAHLVHVPEIEAILSGMNAAHFFIYRDPRDVVVSEAMYITYMNRWHGLHKFMKSLPDDDARIKAMIIGVSKSDARLSYPDIASRFSWYEPWINLPGVFSVKFEDLRGPQMKTTLFALVDFWKSVSHSTEDTIQIVDSIIDNIKPGESHTFRSAQTGGWRTSLSEENRLLFKSMADDLLTKYDFEKDPNWC